MRLIVECQVVGFAGTCCVVVGVEEDPAAVEEGVGVFFQQCVGVVGVLSSIGGGGLRACLLEGGWCAAFVQEVVYVVGIGVVLVGVGAGGVLAVPLDGSAGIEEDGAVWLPVEGYFGEVVADVFYRCFGQHRKVVTVEADFLGVAESHVFQCGTCELVHTFLFHTDFHPLASG